MSQVPSSPALEALSIAYIKRCLPGVQSSGLSEVRKERLCKPPPKLLAIRHTPTCGRHCWSGNGAACGQVTGVQGLRVLELRSRMCVDPGAAATPMAPSGSLLRNRAVACIAVAGEDTNQRRQ